MASPLMKDLVIGADPILFNYQNRRASGQLETRSRAMQRDADVKLTAKTRGDRTV
jgi:hypothetical protein